VRTTVEPLEKNKVKLSIELDETEFDTAIDAAFRKIGREVRIPGFRPGKAPRRLLEARVGIEAARQEAIRDALPGFYERALRENDLEPIAAPEIDITSGGQDGPMAFDAVVEVMPQVSVAGYQGLRIVLPRLTVDETEVVAGVDRLREPFAELRPVHRTARDGDHVSIDRKVYRHTETLAAADDELYEVGTARFGPEMDEQLRGTRAGDILKFNVHHDEIGEVTFQILVKEVREKILPEVTDEWASEASEFDTVGELRSTVRAQLEAVRKLEAALQVRDKVVEAAAELVDDEVPEPLIATEMERRVRLLSHRLGHEGADLATYLQVTGKSQDEFLAELRAESESAVKADLALRAVAEAEGIEATEADVDEEVTELALRRRKKPATVRRELEDEDQLQAVRSGIRKNKALEWLVAHTELVDEEGKAIDRSELQSPEVADTPQAPPEEASE
jgi:trigger factor